jgi:hypothetical protein
VNSNTNSIANVCEENQTTSTEVDTGIVTVTSCTPSSCDLNCDTLQFLQSGLRLDSTHTSTLNNFSRLEMGYTVSASSNPWITHESEDTMENIAEERSTRESERKEQDCSGDGDTSVTSTPQNSALVAMELSSNNNHNTEVGGRATSSSSSRLPVSAFGTPSTVASSDDVSVDFVFDPPTFERLSWKIDDVPGTASSITTTPRPATSTALIQRIGMNSHRRSTSWDAAHGSLLQPVPVQNQWAQRFQVPSSLGAQGDTWNGSGQARVASFRTDQQPIDSNNAHYNYLQLPHADVWRQQQQRRTAEYHQYYANQMPHLQQPGQYHHTAARKPGSPTASPRNRPNVRPTPIRQAGASQLPAGSPAGPTSSPGANQPRSSSEVLKTLLRKKACLYEPDTSKAVALVSWLVGRELALEYGYFSRQQLQSGVHACVATKIDAGAITRTKVNRCMQIILNSCFHYIIPRSDGTEENGDSFREQFAESAQDDHALLATLQAPWTDVKVDKNVVLQASLAEEGAVVKKGGGWGSPQHSPRLSSSDAPASTPDVDGDDHHSKRSVLLCFNENVRSAEDAFRCHNEFIRDAANASKLQLTASEWRSFFGQDSGKPSVAHHGDSQKQDATEINRDFLGEMNDKELATFRTTWCAKRYDHDHYLCGFAHVEVDGGWLRRNPQLHQYRPEMCPDVVTVQDAITGGNRVTIHLCRLGEKCPMAHSREEIAYHPSSYKKNACTLSGSSQGCVLGDVCPNLHPQGTKHTIRVSGTDHHHGPHHPPQRHSALRPQSTHDHFARTGRQAAKAPPSGAPTLYAMPAPFSAFEKQLQMPGLQSLFRRRSSVICSYLDSPAKSCKYSNFGREGDTGMTNVAKPSRN